MLLTTAGCMDARMVSMRSLEVPRVVHVREARLPWQREVDELLARYEAAPLLAPRDEHLEPLFGGITTLTYFGADMGQKAFDQQLPPGWAAPGTSLEAVCAAGIPVVDAPPPPSSSDPRWMTLAGPEWMRLTPVWIPIAIDGGAPPASARCEPDGSASGPEPVEHFCMFGRLALQPHPSRSLVIVVHGLFDSGAQEYVRRIGAELYAAGHSVLLADMRDHGDTWRAAPEIATTLGGLEGADVLALAAAAKRACSTRVARVGAVGVSGGGLDVIRAFTADAGQLLDAGVFAISPLLDVDAAVRDVQRDGGCALSRATELTTADVLLLAVGTGALAFSGAAVGQELAGHPVDENALFAAGIGAGVGLVGGIVIDAWLDGGEDPCASSASTSAMFRDMLQIRWRALRERGAAASMSPAGRAIDPSRISLERYIRERVHYLAEARGLRVPHFDPAALGRDLRAALASASRRDARLLVLGADDDPVTRVAALGAFERHTAALPEVHVRSVRHGGHGAMWVVQPAVMRELIMRFFADDTADRGVTDR